MTEAVLQADLVAARPADRRWPAMLALFALLIVVLLGLGAPTTAEAGSAHTGDGDLLRQLSYAGIFLFLAVTSNVLAHPRRLLVIPLSIALVLAWCWLSLLWSAEPAIAVRRIALATMVIWCVWSAVGSAGYAASLRVLRIVLLLALLANYAAVAVLPTGVHRVGDFVDPDLVGDWRGMLGHKNFTGPVCAITILVYLFAARDVLIWLRLAVIAGAGFFLYKTDSETSIDMLAVAVVVGAAFAFYNARLRGLLLACVALAAALIGVFAQSSWDAWTAPFQSEDSFTGRVQIWRVLLAYSNDHPWLGAGYGSFWNVGANTPLYQYSDRWVAQLGNGHNGYLDLLVQLGWPGLVLAVFAFVVVPFWQLLRRPVGRGEGAMLIACLVFCAGHNFTESTLMDRDMIVQVFIVFTLALIAAAAREAAPRPPEL